MVYAKEFVFLNEQSGATSDTYFNKPTPVDEINIQVSGQAINVKVQGRNGTDEDWVDLTCLGHTAAGLVVATAITVAGLWAPLTLPAQIRMVNTGAPGTVRAFAQIKVV